MWKSYDPLSVLRHVVSCAGKHLAASLAASKDTTTTEKEHACIVQSVRECLTSSAESKISERQLDNGISFVFGEGSHGTQTVEKCLIDTIKEELDARHMQETPELLDKVPAMYSRRQII